MQDNKHAKNFFTADDLPDNNDVEQAYQNKIDALGNIAQAQENSANAIGRSTNSVVHAVVLKDSRIRFNPRTRMECDFQYTFSNHLNFLRSSDADWLFSCAITEAILYFGGITISICK